MMNYNFEQKNKITFTLLLILGFLYFIALPHYAIHSCSQRASTQVKEMKAVVSSPTGDESLVSKLDTLDEYYYKKCLRTSFGIDSR